MPFAGHVLWHMVTPCELQARSDHHGTRFRDLDEAQQACQSRRERPVSHPANSQTLSMDSKGFVADTGELAQMQ